MVSLSVVKTWQETKIMSSPAIKEFSLKEGQQTCWKTTLNLALRFPNVQQTARTSSVHFSDCPYSKGNVSHHPPSRKGNRKLKGLPASPPLGVQPEAQGLTHPLVHYKEPNLQTETEDPEDLPFLIAPSPSQQKNMARLSSLVWSK